MTPTPNPRSERAARELLQIMERQVGIGRQMLAVAKAQTDALAGHDMARLMQSENQVRGLADRQAEYERRREEAVTTLVACEDMAPLARPTAAMIAGLLPQVDAARLLGFREQLVAVERDLAAVTARNRMLLENAQEIARTSLDLLVRAAMARPKYGTNPASFQAPTLYLDQKA